MSNMTHKVGQYHFRMNRGLYVVYYQDTEYSATRVESYDKFEDAVRETYRLNGWGEPKNIVKRF